MAQTGQNLCYQIRLLEKIWPAELNELPEELENLGDYLSDHRDLPPLRQSATERGKKGKTTTLKSRPWWHSAASAGPSCAWMPGSSVSASSPRSWVAFVSRLEYYWQAELKLEPTAMRASKTAAA